MKKQLRRLQRIVNDWLARQRALQADEAEQQRLYESVLKTIGTIHGEDSDRASNAKALLRTKLARRRAN